MIWSCAYFPWWSAVQEARKSRQLPSQIASRLRDNGELLVLCRPRRRGSRPEEQSHCHEGIEPRDVGVKPVGEHALEADEERRRKGDQLQRRAPSREYREHDRPNEEQPLERLLDEVQV